jgi:hypothetical protein
MAIEVEGISETNDENILSQQGGDNNVEKSKEGDSKSRSSADY